MFSAKYLTLFIILFLIALSIHAQSDDDTTRILRFKRLHTIQFNTWVTDVDLMVNPLYKDKNYRLNFQPNTRGQAGFALGLKKFTIALGFQIKGTEENTGIFGQTKYHDFTFGYFQRKFGGEIYYRSFQGMYSLANDYESIKQRPDVYIANGGFNFFYAQNHRNFSMRSVISQQEQQLQAAGSFILLTNIQFRNLKADSSIIPRGIDDNTIFSSLSGLKKMHFVTLNVKPGYAHNFLIPKKYWFFSPSIYAGLGTGWFSTESHEGYKSGMPLDISLHSKTILGYNHPRWFISAFYVYDGSINIFKRSYMSFSTNSVGLNIGYRLNGIGIKWL